MKSIFQAIYWVYLCFYMAMVMVGVLAWHFGAGSDLPIIIAALPWAYLLQPLKHNFPHMVYMYSCIFLNAIQFVVIRNLLFEGRRSD